MTEGRAAPHPDNTLNELTGRGVALLHEVGPHDGLPVGARARGPQGARREQAAAAHGPSHRVLHRTGELVLDPFAGVGGTLLGAAIARGPRRALGIELEPALGGGLRARSCSTSRASATAPGRVIADLGAPVPGGPRGFDPSGLELAARRRAGRPADPVGRIDRLHRHRSALQRPAAADDGRRQAGRDARQPADRLRDGHRITGGPGQRPRLPDVPRSDGRCLRRDGARPAARPLRGGHRPGRLPGRPLPVHRGGLAARASAAGLVPKGDLIWYQAGTRLRPYGYPRAFVPNIAHQHILVLRKDPTPR